MLVGDVANRTAILIDDLADTSNTITRAARLLKKEGAHKVIALITHGVLSGDAIDRINKSDLDHLVVTNSLPQEEHQRRCPKLEVLEIGPIFAEVSFDGPFPLVRRTTHVCRQFVAFTTERVSVSYSNMTRKGWYRTEKKKRKVVAPMGSMSFGFAYVSHNGRWTTQ